MIPNHILSTQIISGYYLTPDNLDVSPVVEYELGGIGLNDVSAGLMAQTWTGRISYVATRRSNGIFLEAENLDPFLFYDARGITEFSLTFDQNMNPFFCFMQNGEAKYRWWDPTIPGYDVVTMDEDVTSPKCCLDDKRPYETSTSDIVLVYKRAGNLYYREQRDRFGVEYLLKSDIIGEVLQVGMTKVGRLQFSIGLQEYPETSNTYRYTKGFRRRVTVGGNPRKIPGVNYGS